MAAWSPTDEECSEILRELLRFRTVSFEGHRTGQNVACVEYLRGLLARIGLETEVLAGPTTQCESGEKPVLLGTWRGEDPALPAVLLNCHYDVVPVLAEHWTKPAWEGLMLREGGEDRIYGRGAQDMKCVCAQYIAAVARLKARGFSPKRTVYLSFVPDEEVGGHGMKHLLESPTWKAMGPLGVTLDEGLANPSPDKFTVFYGERTPWWILVDAKGPTGHGSRFIDGTATNAVAAFAGAAWRYRKQQKASLGLTDAYGCAHCEAKKLGDVATMNLTMLRAGVSADGGGTFSLNVIPTEAQAGFDLRIPVTLPHEEMAAELDAWCREAEVEVGSEEGSVTWSHAAWLGTPLQAHHVSPTHEAHPWWAAFQDGITSLEAFEGGVSLEREIFPAGTDSRFLRALGIPCFGFSPMRGCPMLLHEHDEYIPNSAFVEGIDVYCNLIPRLSELASFEDEARAPGASDGQAASSL